MEQKSGSRIDRKSSIDSEPRTLSFRQIECAREVALFVLKTRSIDEALNIFTEGLDPVVSIGSRINDEENDEYDQREDELLLPDELRDIVTAPF